AKMRLPLLFHDLLVGFVGRNSQIPGQQKIARVPGGDLHHIATLAQLVYIFSKDDFHGFTYVPYLYGRRERHQRDVASLLDRFRQPPLMRCAYARDRPGRDLAALADEGADEPDVFVVDVVDLIDAESAQLLAPEIL